jgi:4-hydroxy-tetrahydrodipicolinate synthase
MVCLGAHGLMNAVGNLLPGKVQELYAATAAGNLSRGRALHYELWELNQAIFFDTNPIPMKYMMKRMGLLPNEMHRLPMVSTTPELRAKLDGVLQRSGLI